MQTKGNNSSALNPLQTGVAFLYLLKTENF